MESDVNLVTSRIIDLAIKVHRGLGPGLYESVYEAVLARELERVGMNVSRQHPVRFDFDGLHFDEGMRVDLLVENKIVVELKSAEAINPVHTKQVLTYLRLLDLQVGLLLNFGCETLRQGIRRIANKFAAGEPVGPRVARFSQ